MELFRETYEIEGIVQGVGFRPGIYSLAVESGLGGWVKNCSGKVLLALEGEREQIDKFTGALPEKVFPGQIDRIRLIEKALIPRSSGFKIQPSQHDSDFEISIPSDLAMCSECEEEILNPQNRRYRYSFTTCTNCGPRYTVVNSMPYDRCRTTLVDFPLCTECEKEYNDPKNRRFHAESIACPTCGPKLFLTDSSGNKLDCAFPLDEAIKELARGKIVAIRGIGGFLLSVNAADRNAIIRLRKRKNRLHKPFAVMARNMDVVKRLCGVNEMEQKALQSSSAPIVILNVKKNVELPVDLISPDTGTLGVMLPYSPLHRLLFEGVSAETHGEHNGVENHFDILIMTSGNRGGEPICISNEEAFDRLNGIADYVLCHNREINLRNDDSLSTFQSGTMQTWRRARGFAPEPVKTDFVFKKTVLAMGAELKNTVALAYNNRVIVSPHIGDLETPEAIDEMKVAAKNFPKFFKKQPGLIAVDLHPDMQSSRFGMELGKTFDIPVVKVQHHHAHAVSCMAENGIDDALALVFDGTGYGLDGNIWGAELLEIKERDFVRLATFEPVPLPGGDAAVLNPIRQLVGRFNAAGIKMTTEILDYYNIDEESYAIWKLQCDKGINAPLTHATGRLFDSFAALIGVSPKHITYEGQAAIRLETEAKKAFQNNLKTNILPFKIVEKNGMLYVDWSEMFAQIPTDKNPQVLALDFHKTVAQASIKMIEFGLSKTSTRNIALSGGVFMNKTLTNLLKEELTSRGLNAFIHKKIPPNDAGISLGQAIVAARQI